MSDLHIDDFYRDCAMVLLQLYSAFPRKASVFVHDIIGHDEPDEFGLHSRRHEACFAAMLWLADEGHLRYEALIRQEAIDQAVLTGPMFALLCASSQDSTSPRTAHIRDALQARSSTAVAVALRELLGIAYRR